MWLQDEPYGSNHKTHTSRLWVYVGCWAHWRRKVFETTISAKKDGLADTALDFIGQLYGVERRATNFNPLERRWLRRKYSKPILKLFKRWLLQQHSKALPKTPIGQAIAYALNHWQALNNYLREGHLNIDNNTAERSIKTVVIGREDWLFAGSAEGARKAAILYSLMETCKLNSINPYAYLKDILTRLPPTLSKDLRSLLPYHWKPLPNKDP